MSLGELAALVRRHVVAVIVVLVFALGTAYTFKHSPPTYQEVATFVLKAPGSGAYSTYGPPLIVNGEIAAEWIGGPQGQQQVRQEGGIGTFEVTLFNYSNKEYPYYGAPYLTVSASAHDPVAAHQTFTAVTRAFNNFLMARQEGVPREDYITMNVIGDSGTLIARGSNVRSFAGLLVLTIVAAFIVSRFLDCHPLRWRGRSVRLRDQVQFLQRAARHPAASKSVP